MAATVAAGAKGTRTGNKFPLADEQRDLGFPDHGGGVPVAKRVARIPNADGPCCQRERGGSELAVEAVDEVNQRNVGVPVAGLGDLFDEMVDDGGGTSERSVRV